MRSLPLALILPLIVPAAALETEAWYRLGEGTALAARRPFDSSSHARNFSSDVNGSTVAVVAQDAAPASSSFYRFDGTQGFYDTGYDAPENNVGIQAWVRAGDLAQGNRTIFSTGGNEAGLQLLFDGPGGGFRAALASRTYVGGQLPARLA